MRLERDASRTPERGTPTGGVAPSSQIVEIFNRRALPAGHSTPGRVQRIICQGD